MGKLDNSLHKPLYVQLIESIKEDIKQGKYLKGVQLPSEPEMCKKYGVSRITIRRAISELVNENILFIQQGKGTFVAETKVQRELLALNGFSDFLTRLGDKVDTRILSNMTLTADKKLADELKVKVGSKVLKLQRVQFRNDDPIHMETSFYPLDRFPDLDKHIGESLSMYNLLKNLYNVQPAHDVKVINFAMASQEQSQILKCSPGTVLYAINKIDFDHKNVPIHLSWSLLPTSRVVFTVSSNVIRPELVSDNLFFSY
jgi:GntR family frlABCD operon transcriptional regulator